MIGIAAVALVMTAWSVGGSMSTYYASIALSMSQSWPNFFFGSFDPAGTVTLDKIPGSFWIPALAVRIFGFSPAAVIVPNALAAAAAAVVTAVTARRWAGPLAGVVAGAVVATTPILVAVARSNQPETFFVLALSLTAWAATRALQRASLGWLLLSGAFIAVGFQTYMLESWAVWPALAAAYLCTRQSWWRRVWHLAVAGALSLGASLIWIVAVSLVPASDRPYIGSTLTNNPWEMVFGYNGLGRFGDDTADATAYRSFTPPFSGSASTLRLLNASLADQIGWMIPTAILAIVILAILRFRTPLLVFGAVWLATFAAMFSVVAGMHQFYTASLAIPMALLIGTAFALARRAGVLWAQIALPGVAALTALLISIAFARDGAATFSLPVAIVQVVLEACVVVLLIIESRRGRRMPVTAAVGVVALLLTPAAWSVVTMWSPNSTNPTAAGVAAMGSMGMGGHGGFGGGSARGSLPYGQGAGGTAGGGGAPGTSASGQTPTGTAARGGAGEHTMGDGTGTTRGSGGAAQGVTGGDSARSQGGALTHSGSSGGATSTSRFGGLGAIMESDTVASARTVAWLTAHQQGTSYLAATFGAQSAASLIIASDGGSVLPIGGFDDRDPVPTLDAFQQLVASGHLRYVLMGSSMSPAIPASAGTAGATGAGTTHGFGARTAAPSGGQGGTDTSTSSGQIRAWVLASCTPVDDPAVPDLYSCGS
ncbi:glycosyltransferase family 39 protein [Microbacterium dextranolyticum]|uniref:Glycosyl transferase n=2 Tax=Microbacterium dextranolyticum TaxID=36806 RepID=A0A9W6HNU7_9MICO|nr:glycosyl transferase [Microbacterium dextranolyticum]